MKVTNKLVDIIDSLLNEKKLTKKKLDVTILRFPSRAIAVNSSKLPNTVMERMEKEANNQPYEEN